MIMAVNNTDECRSCSIANVLSEVNEFIDTLDHRDEVRGEDVDDPAESLLSSKIDNLPADDNINARGDDENTIHDSEELFSSLSSRYQLMNLEPRIDNDENQITTTTASQSKVNDLLGYEYEIDSVCRKSAHGKMNVIDYNGMEKKSETENMRLNRLDHNSCGTCIDIGNETSIDHFSTEAEKSGGSRVENEFPPSQRLQHHQSQQNWQQPLQQQEHMPFSPQETQLSDVQLVKNANNIKWVHDKNNASPQRSSMTTTLSSSYSSSTSRMISPFSSQLIRTNHDLTNNITMPNDDRGRISFSLQYCRKVSLLLKVNPMTIQDQEDDDGYGPILFPASMGSEEGNSFHEDAVKIDWADDNTEHFKKRHREVILVKPKVFEVEENGNSNKEGGFGETSKDRVAGRVTVERARLVAENSQISSEDWARTYKFDAVCWSDGSNTHSYNSLSALASAAVEDVLSMSLRTEGTLRGDSIPCSTIIFALGGSASGKTQTIFGSSIAELTCTANGNADNGHEMGLLGDIMSGILSSQHLSGHEGKDQTMSGSNSDPVLNCSISILEIVNEDVLRDILGSSNEGLGEHGGSKALRVRHSDAWGATVSNLRQVPCESIDQLHELLHYSFKSPNLKRAWNNEGGHGHFIVNVNLSRPSGGCAKIQLVDLASPDRRAMNAAALRSVRKSLSALRGVLRGVAMQHVNQDSASLKAPIPYRESTLTKLLQRSFDHHDGIRTWTRAVVIGTIRPSSKTYIPTLGTIDFMTRILAKAGETANSPFRDGSSISNKGCQSKKVDGIEKGTSRRRDNGEVDDSHGLPNNSLLALRSPTVALKSITSDPRQRLARLVNPTPLFRDDSEYAFNSSNDGLSKNGTLINGSTKCDQKCDSSYGGVFDQLDSLMDIEDIDLDRISYGEGLIEALTPYKTQITSDEYSIDSSDVPSTSPFHDSHSTKTNGFGLVRLQQKNGLRGAMKSSKLHKSEAFRKGTPLEPLEYNTSSVSSMHPKVSDPPSIILPDDSMDSEPLVSSRGQNLFFGDSVPPHKNNSVFQLAKDSPTYEMFESFKQEIDTLVASLTPRRAKHESEKTQMLDVLSGPSDDTNTYGLSNTNQKFILLEAEISSLNSKVLSLTKEKSGLESFYSTIQVIMKEKGSKPAFGSSMPRKYHEILSAIIDRLSMLDNLESHLETSKAECEKLSSELNQAEEKSSNLTQVVKNMERDLAEAHGKNRSYAEATSLLESHNRQLVKQMEDMRENQAASSAFFNQLDELIGIKNDDLPDNDEIRLELRFRCIRNLKSEVQDGLVRLKESAEREQQARDNVDQVNCQIHELNIREQELDETISQLEAKRSSTEKIVEETISVNQNLKIQLADLKIKLAKTQKDYEMLSSAHKSALSESQTLRGENESMRSQAVKYEREILQLNGALAARREDESERDISSFKAKTFTVMKQHMEGLKVDYARRLEDFKSSYVVEKESEKFTHLQLDLSNREEENKILKRRIEQLEKSSSSQLQNVETSLSRMREELIWTRDDASKQRQLNNQIQHELDHLRSLMDIAEESVGELNRLKEENGKHNANLKTRNEHDSRVSTSDEDHFTHERISTLMRENEQNNISMRTLQTENESLRRSIEQCTSTIQLMYSEMSDLKTIAIDGVSRLKTKEKSLLEDQWKSRGVIAEMENKLENANNFIRLLQSSVQSSVPNTVPSIFDRPTTPFMHRISQVENYRTTPPPGSSSMNDRQYAAELSTEKELRCKAEEICAGVLASSKAALEERETEISNLRKQLFRLSGQRYKK